MSVADTAIAKSDTDGSLVYRGYPVGEIAKNATFEETAFLVLNGRLPTRVELSRFAA